MPNDLKKTAGQRLQLLRLEKSFTQEQMGEKLNLSTSAYCKIEYGETDLTLTRLNQIAEILDMPAGELFNKIEGSTTYFNHDGTAIGETYHHSTRKADHSEELRELTRANARLIDMLCKRVDFLEKEVRVAHHLRG